MALLPFDIVPIPLSALEGDNIIELSAKMPWYKGAALLATSGRCQCPAG